MQQDIGILDDLLFDDAEVLKKTKISPSSSNDCDCGDCTDCDCSDCACINCDLGD